MTACSSGVRFLLAISTASDSKMVSTSRKPLAISVLPEETMSKMASAMPTAGAISTDPVMTSTLASMPRPTRYLFRMFG